MPTWNTELCQNLEEPVIRNQSIQHVPSWRSCGCDRSIARSSPAHQAQTRRSGSWCYGSSSRSRLAMWARSPRPVDAAPAAPRVRAPVMAPEPRRPKGSRSARGRACCSSYTWRSRSTEGTELPGVLLAPHLQAPRRIRDIGRWEPSVVDGKVGDDGRLQVCSHGVAPTVAGVPHSALPPRKEFAHHVGAVLLDPCVVLSKFLRVRRGRHR